jgi:hypothetical protein
MLAMRSVAVCRASRGMDAVSPGGPDPDRLWPGLTPQAGQRLQLAAKEFVPCGGRRKSYLGFEPIWEGWEGLLGYPSMDSTNLSYRR